MKKLYKNLMGIIGDNFDFVDNVTIVVKDEVIYDILTRPLKKLHGTNVTNCNNMLAIPAFVNAHTHVADYGIKDLPIGLPTEQAVSPPHSVKYQYLQMTSQEELRDTIRNAVLEMISNGITAFADFREGGRDGCKLLSEVVRELPIEVKILGEFEGGQGVSCATLEYFVEEVEEICLIADGIGLGDITELTDEQLRTIRDVLFKQNALLAVHIAETPQAQSLSKRTWGISEVARIVRFEPDLLIHMTNADEEDIHLLQDKEIPVVCCPRANAVLGDGIPPLAALWEAGTPLALGTDNIMLSSPDMFREMDFFARLVRGQSRKPDIISSKDVLKIATIGGAKALRLDGEYGSLVVGKKASFILLNLNSPNLRPTKNVYSCIVHRACLSDVALVVINGKEIIRNQKGVYVRY
ncbi:MAG: amidohydrolase family protein [Nitrososphaerota archaeon]